MKKQIRKSVFETNSSSVHTISISNTDDYKKVLETYEGKVVGFTSGQFGWEHEEYTSLNAKASYLWTGIVTCGQYTPEKIEKIKDNITSVLIGHGVNAWFEDYETNEYNGSDGTKHIYCDFSHFSYVDHAACLDSWFDDLFPNNGDDIFGDLLLWYLFNPDSIVITSNDNDDYDYNLHSSRGKVCEYEYVKGN